jgi:hypothetical protein
MDSSTDAQALGQSPGPDLVVQIPDDASPLTVLPADVPAQDSSRRAIVGQVVRVHRRASRGWERAFLEAFRTSGNVRASCEAAGVHRTAPYLRAKRDPRFAADWAAAKDDAVDLLESWLWEAGSKGDTRATIFLLKALRPALYRDHVEVRIDTRQAAERIASSLGLQTDDLIARAERLAQELD